MIKVVWSVVLAIEVSNVERSNATVVMNRVRGYSIMILINSVELVPVATRQEDVIEFPCP